MNKLIFYIVIGLLFGLTTAKSQSTQDAVLQSVEKNNKSLMAAQSYVKAQKLGFKTGNTLSNPTVQYEYLVGTPAGAGTQQDFMAVQAFDFPSAYAKRNRLAVEQGVMSDVAYRVTRQELLLDAQLTCIELVYRNKMEIQYARRKAALEKLVQDFQKKLDTGDGNMLDLNKGKLQLLELNMMAKENAVEVQKLQSQLNVLNGGITIVFADTNYAPAPESVPFEQLGKAYTTADPIGQSMAQQQRIADQQLAVSKTWRLPKFEIGYRYQGILGQQFNGVHAGMTLPLWEHKYRIQQQQFLVAHAELQLHEFTSRRSVEIKQLYDRQTELALALQEYTSVISGISNTALLDKALQLGEINVVTYFLETSFYQNVLFHYLKTEYEYQRVVAEMMKYRL